MFTLRDYQEEVLDKMLGVTEGKYGIVYPPGSGKTVIFTSYIKARPNDAHLIVVHRDELVQQTISKLHELGLTAGIEQGDSRANPVEFSKLMEKLKERKSRIEMRIQSAEERLVNLDDTKESWGEKLAKAEERNRKLEEDYELDIGAKKTEWGEKSQQYTRYRNKKKRALEKTQGSLHRLRRIVLEQIPQRERSCNYSLKYNKGELGKLEDIESTEPPAIVVASVQSLHAERLPLWDPDAFDCILFDEAHHIQADSWDSVLEHFEAPLRFGFSATWDPESAGFEKLCTRDIPSMMLDGWLVRPEHVIVDVTGKVAEDTPEHDELITNILCDNKEEKAIVFCASVDQVYRLQAILQRLGIKSGAVSAKTPLEERREIIRQFRAWELDVFLNYQIVYEGFDDPGSTMIVAKNTTYRDVYIQSVGRGFRPARGKKGVKIVDVLTRAGQCTLPVIFGLHRDWVFEKEPLEDYLAAKEFADENNLILRSYPNWGFLRLKKTPEAFRQPRRPDTPYKETLGNTFAITRYGKKYATGVFFGGSRFYSPAETFRHAMKEHLIGELRVAPVKNVAPEALARPGEKLEGMELKRALATQNLRRYGKKNGFLKKMCYTAKMYKLSEKQCDAINRISNALEAVDQEFAEQGEA